MVILPNVLEQTYVTIRTVNYLAQIEISIYKRKLIITIKLNLAMVFVTYMHMSVSIWKLMEIYIFYCVYKIMPYSLEGTAQDVLTNYCGNSFVLLYRAFRLYSVKHIL